MSDGVTGVWRPKKKGLDRVRDGGRKDAWNETCVTKCVNTRLESQQVMKRRRTPRRVCKGVWKMDGHSLWKRKSTLASGGNVRVAGQIDGDECSRPTYLPACQVIKLLEEDIETNKKKTQILKHIPTEQQSDMALIT